MTYKDQPYYKEYRDLLNRLREQVAELKAEKENYQRENRVLTEQLREVRSQLAESRQEIEKLKEELKTDRHFRPENQASSTGTDAPRPNSTDKYHPDDPAPSLFDNLSDTQKIALRQQITELITRIDHHLTRSGNHE